MPLIEKPQKTLCQGWYPDTSFPVPQTHFFSEPRRLHHPRTDGLPSRKPGIRSSSGEDASGYGLNCWLSGEGHRLLHTGSKWGTQGKAHLRRSLGKASARGTWAGSGLHAHTGRTRTHSQVSTHELPSGKATRCPFHSPGARIRAHEPDPGLTARTLWARSPTVTAPSSSHLDGRERESAMSGWPRLGSS